MLYGGNLKKPSRQLLISNALFAILYVICAMQIMSATQPDTFSNVLRENKNSVIGKHFYEAHGRSNLLNEKGGGGVSF